MIAFLLSQIGKIKAGLTSANNNIANLESGKENAWTRLSLPANGSVTFTLGTDSSPYGSVFMFTSGYTANADGMWILMRAESSLVKKEVCAASAITISMDSSGVVTVTSTASSSTFVVLRHVSGRS